MEVLDVLPSVYSKDENPEKKLFLCFDDDGNNVGEEAYEFGEELEEDEAVQILKDYEKVILLEDDEGYVYAFWLRHKNTWYFVLTAEDILTRLNRFDEDVFVDALLKAGAKRI